MELAKHNMGARKFCGGCTFQICRVAPGEVQPIRCRKIWDKIWDRQTDIQGPMLSYVPQLKMKRHLKCV